MCCAVAELLSYAKDVVRAQRLEEDGVLRLRHRVLEARWRQDTNRYTLSIYLSIYIYLFIYLYTIYTLHEQELSLLVGLTDRLSLFVS